MNWLNVMFYSFVAGGALFMFNLPDATIGKPLALFYSVGGSILLLIDIITSYLRRSWWILQQH